MSRRLIAALSLVLAAGSLYGQSGEAVERVTTDDDVSELVRRYVEARTKKPLFWKPCLNLGGDVRFQYDHYDEWGNAFHPDVATPGINFKKKSPNSYNANANIYLEFDTRRTWAKLQIEATNPGGTFPEKKDGIRVKRALMGYTIYECGCDRWYVELGRQKLCEHFDSEVQYGSRLDGVFTRVGTKLPRLGESYIQGGYNIVNVDINQYAYIVEAGALNILDQCIYAKLSFVDWTNGGISTRNRELFVGPVVSGTESGSARSMTSRGLTSVSDAAYKAESEVASSSEGSAAAATASASAAATATQTEDEVVVPKEVPDLGYRVVQLLVGKKFPNVWMCKKAKVFGAILYNLDPSARSFDVKIGDVTVRRGPFLHDHTAWYAGVQLGEVCKCGDWAFKIVYQYVQPFSILPEDNNGIGRTNDPNDLYIGSGILLAVTNYKGFETEVAYAFTDHITVRAQFQHADQIRKDLLGSAHFNHFMIRALYAF